MGGLYLWGAKDHHRRQLLLLHLYVMCMGTTTLRTRTTVGDLLLRRTYTHYSIRELSKCAGGDKVE